MTFPFRWTVQGLGLREEFVTWIFFGGWRQRGCVAA